MNDDREYPRFANEFRHVVVTAYDQLAMLRERTPDGDGAIVQLRADAIDGTSAMLIVGSIRDMDEFASRLTFASDAPASMPPVNPTKESLMTKILDWTKKARRQKKAKAAGPVDRALAIAKSMDGTLLAVANDKDGAMVALVAEGEPGIALRFVPGTDIPENQSRVHAFRLHEDGRMDKDRIFDRSFEASMHYSSFLPESERDVFQSALMFADARWLMGPFPDLNDVYDVVPLVNPDALDSIHWNDPAKCSQLLALAVSIGPVAYGKIALHPRMDGIKPDEKGLMLLAGSYFGTDDPTPDPAPAD